MMIIDERKVNLAEKDIEQWLYENPRSLSVHAWGESTIKQWTHRQLQVPSGIIDLVGITDSGHLVVVEVKNTKIEASALTQVARYAYDLQNIIQRVEEFYRRYDCPTVPIHKVVVGRSISDVTFREAEALHVRIVTFNIALSLNLSETLWWTRSFEQERHQFYDSLAQTDDFRAIVDEYQKERRHQLPRSQSYITIQQSEGEPTTE